MSNRRMVMLDDYRSKLSNIGQSLRATCPSCGSTGFTMSRVIGGWVWNCYRASCNEKGIHSVMNTEDLRQLRETMKRPEKPAVRTPFEPPLSFTRSTEGTDDSTVEWVDRSSPIRSVYAVRDNRGRGQIINAVGRKLYHHEYGPKWKDYGQASYPFVRPAKGSTGFVPLAIVVEDPLSAMSAASFNTQCDGVALLGTKPTDVAITEVLSTYEYLIVCLDRDAALQGASLARDLAFRLGKPVQTYLPSDDLKYRNPSDVRKLTDMLETYLVQRSTKRIAEEN